MKSFTSSTLQITMTTAPGRIPAQNLKPALSQGENKENYKIGSIIRCIARYGRAQHYVRIAKIEPRCITVDLLACTVTPTPFNGYESTTVYTLKQPFQVVKRLKARYSKQHEWNFMETPRDISSRFLLCDVVPPASMICYTVTHFY